MNRTLKRPPLPSTRCRSAAFVLTSVGLCSSCGEVPDGLGDDPSAAIASALLDAPVEDCSKYPFSAEVLLSERVGFGRSATGGDPSRVFHVTSLADSGSGTLREAVSSTNPYYVVFDVEGTIKLKSRLDVRSNKTVDGRGRAVTVDGTWRLAAGTKNVILSDLTLIQPAGFDKSDGDTIEVRGKAASSPGSFETRDLWFHHLGLGRGGDGQLDLRGATNVTVSWSHLYAHAKSMLHWKDSEDGPVPHMRVTVHHNFFEKITRRSPQFSFGLCDSFNNYLYHWYEYGSASNDTAQFLSEANIYEARPGLFCLPGCPDPNSPTHDSDFWVSKKALVAGWDNTKGYIRSTGDLLLNDARVEQNEPTKVFSRSTYYSATIERADDTLRTAIKDGAGPRTRYCKP